MIAKHGPEQKISGCGLCSAGNQPEAERQSVSVRNRFPLFSRERFGTLLREASQREKLSAMLKKAGSWRARLLTGVRAALASSAPPQ